MKLNTLLVCSVLTFLGFSAANAQSVWPNKAVKIIVAAAPGGSTDIFGRLIALRLSEKFGQPFVVENKSGGGGSIGALAVLQSPADGYTLLMTADQLVAHAALNIESPKMPYNAIKDFAPISVVASGPLVLGVNSSFPAKSVGELVALVKANPGKYAYSSCGHGTVNHLTGEMFNLAAGIDLQHLAYKGCAPAILDAVSGQAPIFISVLPNAAPYEKSGKLRLLAVTSSQRLATFPNVPTLTELGYKGFNVTPWFGLLAPGATPKAIVMKLSTEVAQAVGGAEFAGKIRSMYMETSSPTPEFFSELILTDYTRWSKVVREAKIKAD